MPNRLTEGVWELEVGLVAPLASNAYLVDDGDAVTLIDTGLPVNRPSLRSELDAVGDGYMAGEIDRVLLTHYDLDHTGGLPGLSESGFDGSIHIGAADARLANGEDRPSMRHPKGVFHRLIRPFFGLPATVMRVNEGDQVGGFTAFHTPGHNPGHIVYIHDDLGTAFLGDLIWAEGGSLIPPIWLDSYDMYQLRASIRAFANRAPQFDTACPGHGRPIVMKGYDALMGLVARL